MMFTGSETSKSNQSVVSGMKCSLQSFSGKSETRVSLKVNVVCASIGKFVADAELQRSFTQVIFSVLIPSALTFREYFGNKSINLVSRISMPNLSTSFRTVSWKRVLSCRIGNS